MSDIECSNSMFKFKAICKRLGVPIAAEKNGRSCEKYGILWMFIHVLPEQPLQKCRKMLKRGT
jgi:hypothetical protein